MDINLTIIGQTITFVIFVWFTVRFVWPPLMQLMETRRASIADGIAAGEKGQAELAQAHDQAKQILTDARTQAGHVIEQANHRSNHVIEEAKQQARLEGDRLLKLSQEDIEQAARQVREELRQKTVSLAILAAQKILQHEVDHAHAERVVSQMLDAPLQTLPAE